ncbi:MAG: serine/threonine protein kinase [Oscillospiraceae bacterium]|nr:serine/threonine protein kinase [Oscillospiraceae bacterium]
MEKMTVNDREFEVLRLLGKGKGGYSYLVTDGKGQYVLKQIHHEPCDYYTFGDKLQSELRDYKILKNLGIPLPELLDVDYTQERLLKTFIDGDTVNVLVKEDRMEPAHYDQIRAICERLYAVNLNIDYYPTNFVAQEGQLYYIDFECNPYMEQWNYENWGCKYWTKTEAFAAAFGI